MFNNKLILKPLFQDISDALLCLSSALNCLNYKICYEILNGAGSMHAVFICLLNGSITMSAVSLD